MFFNLLNRDLTMSTTVNAHEYPHASLRPNTQALMLNAKLPLPPESAANEPCMCMSIIWKKCGPKVLIADCKKASIKESACTGQEVHCTHSDQLFPHNQEAWMECRCLCMPQDAMRACHRLQ